MRRVVAGKTKSESAFFLVYETYNSSQPYLTVSTREGNATFQPTLTGIKSEYIPDKYQDYTLGGTIKMVAPSLISQNYFTMVLNLLNGLKDVYSIKIDNNQSGVQSIIDDLQSFFAQFPNLYSICIKDIGEIKISGNIALVPDSVERIKIENLALVNNPPFTLNFSGFSNTSRLKYFNFAVVSSFGSYQLPTSGDLAKLPVSCQFLYLASVADGSIITYTAGKVWASSFDTLYFPITLTASENDALLNDMAASITSAIGGKTVTLQGNRTSASDSAVSSLLSKGFTINCFRNSKILDLPLQNNFTDYSDNPISMVAANGNGLPSFVSDGSSYALDISASKALKTATNLPFSSDKVSIAFFIKTTQTATACILETAFSSSNSFTSFINDLASNKIELGDFTTGTSYNFGTSNSNINTGNWVHVVLTIDRALGITQNAIYLDNVLSFTQYSEYSADNNGNFTPNILNIGSREGSSYYLTALLKQITIWNYIISSSERLAHKNR